MTEEEFNEMEQAEKVKHDEKVKELEEKNILLEKELAAMEDWSYTEMNLLRKERDEARAEVARLKELVKIL